MTTAISLDLLRRAPIFRGLNETECRQIAEILTTHEFAPGQLVLRQGQTDRHLWVVIEGRCEVLKRLDPAPESVPLAVLEPYQHFGEMSFFHPAPHSADVRAQTRVELLRIAHSDYKDLVEEGVWAAYKVAYNVVESLATRLRRMDDWVAELMTARAGAEPIPEWTTFREKLFERWNL